MKWISKLPYLIRLSVGLLLWVDVVLEALYVHYTLSWVSFGIGLFVAIWFSNTFIPPIFKLGKYNFHRIPKGQRIKISCGEYRKKVAPR